MNDEQTSSDAASQRPTWLRITLRLLKVLAATTVLLIVATRLLSSSLIFHPARHPPESERPYPAPPSGCEDIYLKTSDGVRIHAWLLWKGASVPTVIFLHGNAGNLDHRRGWIVALGRIPVNVMAVDYRGYGRSEGTPTEAGIHADTKAAYDYLVSNRRVDARNLVVYGNSLGGGPACELALRHDCAGLILQSTFTSIPAMANLLIWPLPIGWFVSTQFDNKSKVGKITCPKLIMHSRADEMIPYRMAEELFDACCEPRKLVTFERSGHNYLVIEQRERVIAAITRFLAGLASGKKGAK